MAAKRKQPKTKSSTKRKKAENRKQSNLTRYDIIAALRSEEPLAAETFAEVIAKHQEFLDSGGGGGSWETFSTERGLILGVYLVNNREQLAGEQMQLQHKCLEGLNLCGVVLAYANLCGVACRSQDLSHANLSGCLATDADFSGTNFQNANLAGADLSRSELVNCDFRGADLTNTDFEQADLSNADLRGAILTGTKFPGARLDDVKKDPENVPLLNRIICPKCRHKGAYWLRQDVLHGNPYSPASDTEVENFYRCANAGCQHEWSDID